MGLAEKFNRFFYEFSDPEAFSFDDEDENRPAVLGWPKPPHEAGHVKWHYVQNPIGGYREGEDFDSIWGHVSPDDPAYDLTHIGVKNPTLDDWSRGPYQEGAIDEHFDTSWLDEAFQEWFEKEEEDPQGAMAPPGSIPSRGKRKKNTRGVQLGSKRKRGR